jgi:hypothetical protein
MIGGGKRSQLVLGTASVTGSYLPDRSPHDTGPTGGGNAWKNPGGGRGGLKREAALHSSTHVVWWIDMWGAGSVNRHAAIDRRAHDVSDAKERRSPSAAEHAGGGSQSAYYLNEKMPHASRWRIGSATRFIGRRAFACIRFTTSLS